MGLRFVLTAYFIGGFGVSALALIIGTPPIFALQIGFWLGGLGAGVLAALYDNGYFPFRDPHDTF